ncbi:MAG: 2,3-bisphosphoglycerate-independent phosphoglycerate mutase [Puniceicoccales bacterium]|jgi:2,3-bisphosphoglycerate-independent phosphoglycerate mutase|nr:2,3-bisphosphoglycerate-independent phosphoglycerate mutase [Puniceicoccales bacterium]
MITMRRMSTGVVPTVLIIRDGWGCNHSREENFCNAILRARIPFSNSLSANWPRTEIEASGLAVGLPEGVMGNSEVGHQNIGAGRVVDQEIVRIDKAMAGGEFEQNSVFREAIRNAEENNSKLHLIGLCSDGGVHSVMRHLFSILQFSKNAGLEDVCIHFISDGRDTPRDSGAKYCDEIEKKCKEIGVGRIATVIGRFWAMDRDNRWERVREAYNCMTGESGFQKFQSAKEAVEHYYRNPKSATQTGDEFIPPMQILDGQGVFSGQIGDNDSILFLNFRGDRPREITRAFLNTEFSEFPRKKLLKLYYATLTEYEVGLCPNVIFRRPEKMKNILGEYISSLGLKQFRCAETEKYAHVTFFFNDYRENPFPGEDRKLIASPKDVETYDQRPEMSALAVKDEVRNAILERKYSLIVVNFANPDMIGHTGNVEAGVRAAEVVDGCIEELLAAVDEAGGNALITADHGNLEKMVEIATGKPFTQHTTNPVEVVIYGKKLKSTKLRPSGALCDIAPTLLQMLQLPQPSEMSGTSLVA